MLAEAAKYGSVEIRRIYGDWASGKLSSWRPTVQQHALVPVQQFTAVSGKNPTDSALIIDAMDILHSGRVRGFCIVSSDSDFTRLATRLRESGMFVSRDRQSPNSGRLQERLQCIRSHREPDRNPRRSPTTSEGEKASRSRGSQCAHPVEAAGDRRGATEAFELIDKAFDSVVGEDGSCHLAELGNALLKLDPAFDPRTFGKSKLGDLLEAIPGKYELQRPPPRTSGAVLVKRRLSGRS